MDKMRTNIQLIFFILLISSIGGSLEAQIDSRAYGYYEDALRYSESNTFGSARFMSLGSAGTALGGEMGAIAINPAGLGFFNRNQFVITPGLHLNKSVSTYFGNAVDNERLGLNLANAGFVINFNKGDLVPGKWRGGSFGFTYNRTNNFNQNIQYSGFNNQNSIIDAMLEQSNGLDIDQLSGLGLVGYDHYLINPLSGTNNIYDSFVLGFPDQRETIKRRGGIDQVNISYGTNYDDKIYLGAGLGIISTNYSLSRIFSENFTGEPLEQFSTDEWLKVSGTGANLTLGVILRPFNFIRFGASYTSPTWFDFNEEGDAYYESNYNNYDVANWTDDDGNRLILEDTILNTLNSSTELFVSNYTLRTPGKLNTGISVILGKSGFFSADVELVDHSSAHVSSNDFISEGDNNTINDLYKPVVNIKLGGEIRINILRLRAGLAIFGDPYNFTDQIDRSKVVGSVGAGLNFGKYFFDVGYSRTSFDESVLAYSMANGGPAASIANTQHKTQFSFGLNF